MKRFVIVVLATLAFPVAPTFAQDAAPGATSPYTATDGTGAELSFDEPVERIACLYRTCDGYLADLGLPPVATNEPPGSLALPRLFGNAAAGIATFEGESVEEVASYEPDLIVVGPASQEARDAMSVVAPVFMVSPNERIEGYYRDLTALGTLTGRTTEAEAAITRFQAVVAAVAAKAPEGASERTVMFLFDTDPENYYLAFEGTLMCNLIAANGLGTCPIATPKGLDIPYGVVDAETVLAVDPDVIGIIGRLETGDAPERTDPVWEQLSAVQEGHVYADDSFGLYCCGLREAQWSLELYVFMAFPGAGYADPGQAETYDPASPANLDWTDATPAA